jgi:integrase
LWINLWVWFAHLESAAGVRWRDLKLGKHQKLTASMVERLGTPGLYKDEITGLYLRVSDKDTKAWIFRFMLYGKSREMGLGPFPLVKLPDARSRALAARRLLVDGKDPIEARRAARVQRRLDAIKGVTFKEFATDYIANRKSEWKSAKHRKQWDSSLAKYVYPIMGDLPVGKIDPNCVLKLFEQNVDGEAFWCARTPTANRVRERIELILDAAAIQGLRDGPNPARWRGNLKHVLSAPAKIHVTRHHRSLHYDALPAFMTQLAKRESPVAMAFRFLILTATRTNEVRGATWDEIDRKNKVWVIPWHRIKHRKQEDGPHRIPLSDAALEIIDAMQVTRKADVAFIFPAVKGGSAKPIAERAIEKMCSRMKCVGSPHGFRAAFKTWATEQTTVQRDTIEAALSHIVGDRTERAYQRSDWLEKRRKLMEAWGRFAIYGPADNVRRLAG